MGLGVDELDSGLIKVMLAHVEEKRQSERYANDKTCDDRQPQPAHSEAVALGENENPEHQRRNDDIETKEASDAVGKQLMTKKWQIEAMLEKPWNQLRVRQHCADNA